MEYNKMSSRYAQISHLLFLRVVTSKGAEDQPSGPTRLARHSSVNKTFQKCVFIYLRAHPTILVLWRLLNGGCFMGFITLARLLGLAIRLFSQFLGRQRCQKFIYSLHGVPWPPQLFICKCLLKWRLFSVFLVVWPETINLFKRFIFFAISQRRLTIA